MGFRFRKSFGIIGNLVKFNINKNSISITAGVPGAHITANSKGIITGTAGIPGTGISYQARTSLKSRLNTSNDVLTTNNNKIDTSYSDKVLNIFKKVQQDNYIGCLAWYKLSEKGKLYSVTDGYFNTASKLVDIKNNIVKNTNNHIHTYYIIFSPACSEYTKQYYSNLIK